MKNESYFVRIPYDVVTYPTGIAGPASLVAEAGHMMLHVRASTPQFAVQEVERRLAELLDGDDDGEE